MEPGRWRWVALGVFVLSSALNSLDRALLGALTPTLQAEFDLSLEQIGYIVAAFSFSYSLSAPLMGLLVDRLGLTRGITTAVAWWSLAGLATGFAGSLPALMACRAALGVGEAAGIPASAKAAALYLHRRELALGSAMGQVGLTVGGVAAPLLAAWATRTVGWPVAFQIAGVLGFLWIPLWVWTARRIPVTNATVPGMAMPVSGLMRDRRLWGLIAANILAMPTYTLWTNWTTAFFRESFRLAEADANRLYAWLPPVFALLGGLFGGWLALRGTRPGAPMLPVRLRICLFAALMLMGTALIPLLPTATLAAAGICYCFFWTVTLSVNLYAIPLDLFGPDRAAFATAWLTGAYGLLQTFLSPLIGRVADRHGFGPVCVAIALLPLCAVGVLALTQRTRPA